MTAERIRVGISYRGRPGREADSHAGDGPPAWFAGYSRDLELIELCCTFDRLLPAEAAHAWVASAPPGFMFDVRAFRALTRHLVRRSVIPASLQPELRRSRDPVRPADLLGPGRYELWERFRNSLEPLRRAGKLGTIILRFPRSFGPDLAGQAFLAILAERLPGDRLAVELPASWFSRSEASATATLLDRLGLGVVGGTPQSAAVDVERLPKRAPVAALRVDAGEANGAPLDGIVPGPVRRAGRESRPRDELHVLVSGGRALASVAARRLSAAMAGASV